MLYTGLGVVLGHNFPCWLQFRGGKGIAATAGVMIVFSPIMSAFALGIFIVSAIVSKYVSLSSLLVTTFFPIWVAFAYRGDVHMLFVSMMFTVLAFYKHRANIDRLLHGTEYKIGERVSVK